MDVSKELSQGEFRKKLRAAGYSVHISEPYTPWSDRAALVNRELKRKTRRQMIASHCPKRLWDDCQELMADINTNTVHRIASLTAKPPCHAFRYDPDIPTLAEVHWYQFVKWLMMSKQTSRKIRRFTPDIRSIQGEWVI